MGSQRRTRQRSAVETFLNSTDQFRSAQEIHMALKRQGTRIGLATVYRNLQQMAQNDQVDTVHNEYGEALYRRCKDSKHHHHLVCRRCGLTRDIAADAVERWVRDVAHRYGFSDVEHTADLFGLCADCAQAQAAEDAAAAAAATPAAATAAQPAKS